MNHSKIILVACISAFVAMTTAVLGVAGTIIGSVLSSVLYNVLSEALEKPVTNAKFSTNFEWDIAYVFPLVVVLIIQLLLILAFLSEWGFLPSAFLNIYLSIQGVASNNLYRVLGFSLIVMSVYPFILKRDLVKKSDGIIILLIGLIFLARGFSDGGSTVSHTFSVIFDYVDFPMALIAFLLLIYVINNILSSARASEKEFNNLRRNFNENDYDDLQLKNIHRKKNSRNLDDLELKQVNRRKSRRTPPRQHPRNNYSHNRNNTNRSKRKINESIDGFQFESNDLLDDYKK
ncbi:MAG: hypothetical protein IJQ68_02025 [Methanobrevibacter sp.]|uniref:hypothetical protein n=1 Tax=Methanobrevibacter sp. TaxID=66852 RepID=UPI0025FE67C8|nr:hypothetical protein [Methanobrevibacter sp.]MBR0270759.1 hypothetical protein [Methanobrevibacter sp.]